MSATMSRCSFRWLTASPLLSLAAVLVGCGGESDRPKTVPVTGAVLYKGEPVEGAQVSFWADKAPRSADGVTNAEGKFSLSMFDINDGALPGSNKITVTKTPAAPAGSAPTKSPEEMLSNPAALVEMSKTGATDSKQKPLLPDKYSSLKTTPLKETVAESGPNNFVLQLTD